MGDLVERLKKPAPAFGMEYYDPTFDVRQEAAKRIAELEAALAWHPIETAPRVSRLEFLAWDGEHPFVAHWNSGAWWSPAKKPCEFTHWMPIPAPPSH